MKHKCPKCGKEYDCFEGAPEFLTDTCIEPYLSDCSISCALIWHEIAHPPGAKK